MVDSYTLGPISAGADSPLGAIFGFASMVSKNFETGQQVYVNNPQVGNAIITGQPLSDAGKAALAQAVATPRTDNPIVGIGQDIGSLFGAGFQGLGSIIGIGGHTAAPGVAGGASAGVGGIAEVGTAGIGGALQGLFSGSVSGIGTALGVGSNSAILLLGGGALLLLFLLLM